MKLLDKSLDVNHQGFFIELILILFIAQKNQDRLIRKGLLAQR